MPILGLLLRGTGQGIQFAPAPELYAGDSATVSATASSGLPVSFSSQTPDICTVDATGLVTGVTHGTCRIVASQAGNDIFEPAPPAILSFAVLGGFAQTISFAAAPTVHVGLTASVAASATSGLPVSYSSLSTAYCSVHPATGLVTGVAAGPCEIAADQMGNAVYDPAPRVTQTFTVSRQTQSIAFAAAPTLAVGGTASVSASATSGLPVTYASQTPGNCSVNSSSGLVSGLAAGPCTIGAQQAGNATFEAAADASQSFSVAQAVPPGAPAAVAAELGSVAGTVTVSFAAADGHGSSITGYTVVSSPVGITGTGTASPITVSCPAGCPGRTFSVFATSAGGDGASSPPVHVVTSFHVVETFFEPATQPNDSIFTGDFVLDSTTGTVSGLTGTLTESMTGGCATITGCPGSYGDVPMTLVDLTHQLSVIPATVDGASGLLVTTFALSTTNTFYAGTPTEPVGDGWSPASGVEVGGIYYGWPAALNPSKGGVGNAYAMIFVNLANPMATPTQLQLDRLAYADCAAGGMMGAVCMTGTTVAGYGAVGTMGGYPVSQVISRH